MKRCAGRVVRDKYFGCGYAIIDNLTQPYPPYNQHRCSDYFIYVLSSSWKEHFLKQNSIRVEKTCHLKKITKLINVIKAAVQLDDA